jgi:hypothetical protein
VRSITSHPSLRLVLLPLFNGNQAALFIGALNVIVGLARAPHLEVRAVSYGGIENEWLEWLEALDD